MKTRIVSAGTKCVSKFCVAAFLASLFATVLSPATLEAAPRVGDTVPNAVLSGLTGKSVTVGGLKGKVVLVHFWISTCPFCVKEINALELLYRKYKTKGVLPHSINAGESKETTSAYITNLKVSYPILLDPGLSVTKQQYGVTGIPTTYILDRQGVIRFRILGEITFEGLERIVRTLL